MRSKADKNSNFVNLKVFLPHQTPSVTAALRRQHLPQGGDERVCLHSERLSSESHGLLMSRRDRIFQREFNLVRRAVELRPFARVVVADADDNAVGIKLNLHPVTGPVEDLAVFVKKRQ